MDILSSNIIQRLLKQNKAKANKANVKQKQKPKNKKQNEENGKQTTNIHFAREC